MKFTDIARRISNTNYAHEYRQYWNTNNNNDYYCVLSHESILHSHSIVETMVLPSSTPSFTVSVARRIGHIVIIFRVGCLIGTSRHGEINSPHLLENELARTFVKIWSMF